MNSAPFGESGHMMGHLFRADVVFAWVCIAPFVLGCHAAAAPDAAAPAPPDVSSATADLGALIAGTAVAHTFKIVNTGTEPFRIISVDKSCSCQEVNFDSEEMIAAGKTGNIAIKIATKGFEGRKRWLFTVHTSAHDKGQDAIPLSLTADMIAKIKALPSAISFGVMHAGMTIPTKKLQISEAHGDVQDKFTGFTVRQDVPTIRVIRKEDAPPGTVILDVGIAENAPLGDLVATIVLNFTDHEVPSIEIPVAGRIEGIIVTTPRVLTVDSGQTFVPTVKLSAKDGRSFKVLKTDVDGRLLIAATTESESDHLYKITCGVDVAPGKYTAVFHTDVEDQKVISLPIVIFKK